MIKENRKSIISIEETLKKYEEERKKDRTDILGILYRYEQVTDSQYKENKMRIEKIEKRLKVTNIWCKESLKLLCKEFETKEWRAWLIYYKNGKI